MTKYWTPESVHDGEKPKHCDYANAQKCATNNDDQTILQKNNLFKCNVCHKDFSQKQDLEEHIEKFHEGITICNCKMCSFTTTKTKILDYHASTVHKDLRPFISYQIEGTAEYVIMPLCVYYWKFVMLLKNKSTLSFFIAESLKLKYSKCRSS